MFSYELIRLILYYWRGCQYFLVDSFGGVSGVDASDITATASSRTKQQTFIRQSINPTLFTGILVLK